ncbi:MAG TPA: S41 family peptidase [Pyrinomonadaceae bacterium]|nr:S41 family peptidase [Pyrinomonadaceae bacterium]
MYISHQQLRRLIAPAFLTLAFLNSPVVAQRPPDTKLNADANKEVVQGVIRAINKYYVSAEVAKQVEKGLQQRLQNGDYNNITSAFDLIDALDLHMQEISKDKHLALAYSHKPEPLLEGRDFDPETPQEREEGRIAAQERNFGFEKVQRLAGNIGYLEMNSFVRPEFSGDMARNVMTFLANTDAMIIDLRTSNGGSADMVAFLASYFFNEEPVHLGDWFVRAENRVQQWWTYPYMPGGRYLGKDVYILLSRRSFSAVEGLASILQHHKRAVIVGEPTRGGTHPGRFVRVHPNFAVFVPMSWFIYPTGTPVVPIDRPVYPTSRTDYQGTGVTPDINIAARLALKRAHLEALNKKLEKNPAQKGSLQPLIDTLKKDLEAPPPAP